MSDIREAIQTSQPVQPSYFSRLSTYLFAAEQETLNPQEKLEAELMKRSPERLSELKLKHNLEEPFIVVTEEDYKPDVTTKGSIVANRSSHTGKTLI